VLEIMRVALPMMVSTACTSLALFVDRTFLHFVSDEAMAAGLTGGNLFWVSICLPVGGAAMTGAFIAQYLGAGRQREVGRLVGHMVLLGVLLTPLYPMLIPFVPKLLAIAGHDPTLSAIESTYIRILLFGAGGAVIESALSGFFSGTERTRVIMVANVLSTAINIVLDAILIFGVGGMLEYGVAGAAWATVISIWFKPMFYGYRMMRPVERGLFGLALHGKIDWQLMRHLIFYSFPAGVHYFAESAAFSMILLRIGAAGSEALAATSMAINFNMLAFIPMVGLSVATSVLVGRYLVDQGADMAARVARSAIVLAMIYSGAWAIVYVGFPNALMWVYRTTDASGTSTRQTAEVAAVLLRFVALYCLLDAIQAVLAGALRGAGDTWYVLLSFFIVSTSAVLIGWSMEGAISNQLYWWWVIITAWVWMLAAVMLLRFLSGAWRDKRLVQPPEI
jgi:multidrug resistance protein, MATE family